MPSLRPYGNKYTYISTCYHFLKREQKKNLPDRPFSGYENETETHTRQTETLTPVAEEASPF
jgi:hypothetical protein